MPRLARPVSAALIALTLALSPFLMTAVGVGPAISAAAAEGDVTWSVEPSPTADGVRRSFEYSVDPGTQIVDSILITNQGETPASFIIYATDAVNDFETGAFGLLKRDEPPTDSGAWITTELETLSLDPGMQATVPFNLLVPSDAAPGDHIAGIVASVLTEGEQDGAAVTLEQRVGARVYLTVSGIREAGVEVSGFTAGYNASLNPFAPGELTTRYQITNTGNTRIDVNQAIQVTGPFGIPLGEFTPEPISELLPRQSVQVTASMPAIGALLLAWSDVTALPGEVGSAGEVDVLDLETLPLDELTGVPSETAVAVDPAAVAPPAGDPAVSDTVAITDADTVEYVPVSSTVIAPTISWTLLAIIVLVLGLIYLIARYVSGTRERMYLAIDEAAAAARAEALSPSNSPKSVEQ